MRHSIFFCHIPKTGGTSVRMALEQHFKPFEVMPDRLMMRRNGGKYPSLAVVARTMADNGNGVRLLRGHYPLSASALLPDCKTLAVLRDPVERAVSNLKHSIRNGKSVDEILKSLDEGSEAPGPGNAMVHYLGKPLDLGGSGPVNDPQTLFDDAINALESIDILGTTERLDLLAGHLSDLIGQPIAMERLNVGADTELPLTDAHLATLAARNHLDRMLYEAARRIVDRRAAAVSI